MANPTHYLSFSLFSPYKKQKITGRKAGELQEEKHGKTALQTYFNLLTADS
jgi:hypothetical protein